MTRDHARALAALADDLTRRGLAPGSCDTLTRTARLALTTIGKPVRRITATDVRRFVAGRSLVLGPGTHVNEVSRLRVVFGAFAEAGLLKRDPTLGLVVERAPRPVRLLLSEPAVGSLLEAALVEVARQGGRLPALRDRAALELLYGLGLRAAEARAARVVDLDLQRGTFLVRAVKRGANRTLPLPPASIEHLRRYLDEARPVLVVRRGEDPGHLLVSNAGTPICVNGVRVIVNRVAAKAGLEAHPHAFRRAISTHMVRAGASVVVVADLLGHARLDSVKEYVEVEREDLRRAVGILDRRA